MLKFLRLPTFGLAALALMGGMAQAADKPADPPADKPADKVASTPFTLPALPYAYDALEPYIDAQTMALHYSKHHQAYVDNLNKKVAEFPKLAEGKIEDVMANIGDYDTVVRNNGGGHYNHSLFWTILAPEAKVGKPDPLLLDRIKADFKSQQAMVEQFNKSAAANFGSGWTWLIAKPDGRLAIVNTPNQDNPLMGDAKVKGTPLFALDTWEHAYYLKYQNRRPEYIAAFWKILNWNEVNKRYEASVNK